MMLVISRRGRFNAGIRWCESCFHTTLHISCVFVFFRICTDWVPVFGPKSRSLYLSKAPGIPPKVSLAVFSRVLSRKDPFLVRLGRGRHAHVYIYFSCFTKQLIFEAVISFKGYKFMVKVIYNHTYMLWLVFAKLCRLQWQHIRCTFLDLPKENHTIVSVLNPNQPPLSYLNVT